MLSFVCVNLTPFYSHTWEYLLNHKNLFEHPHLIFLVFPFLSSFFLLLSFSFTQIISYYMIIPKTLFYMLPREFLCSSQVNRLIKHCLGAFRYVLKLKVLNTPLVQNWCLESLQYLSLFRDSNTRLTRNTDNCEILAFEQLSISAKTFDFVSD